MPLQWTAVNPLTWDIHMKPIHCAAILVLCCAASSMADQPDGPAETFYQRVDIQRSPQFAVQGVNVNQQIHYRILSSFQVYPPDERGRRKAVQTITDATLVEADPLSHAVFTQSLSEMQGRTFTFQVGKFSEVVSMEGHQDNTKSIEVKKPKSKGMLVSSVIDEDGWKELAQLTLFQPPQTGQTGRSFTRKTTHDWGALGSWYGKTNFTPSAESRNKQKFSYQHHLEYIPPNKEAGKMQDALPFEIESAKFRAYEAWGEIQYDTKHRRVTNVREVFHARGVIATSMLGIPSTVKVNEKQVFTIAVTGQRLLKVDPPRQPTSR